MLDPLPLRMEMAIPAFGEPSIDHAFGGSSIQRLAVRKAITAPIGVGSEIGVLTEGLIKGYFRDVLRCRDC
jgi:hypothetical protein